MKALVLNCTLKAAPEPSNTEALAKVVMAQLRKQKVAVELIRAVDLNLKPGVKSDEGRGDEWPGVREKILSCDILVIATPTWLGQPSSICQRVLERMDAMFGESKDDGRPLPFDKVAGVVVTGNEDGAHHIVAIVCQALIDLGFTIPGQSWTYWHLGPGAGPNYLDTDKGHEWSDRCARNAARNLVAVAKALQAHPLPEQETAD